MAKAYFCMQNCMQRPLDWKMLLSIDQRVSMKKGAQDGAGVRGDLLPGVVAVFMEEQ
jgi:hypothetical protein